MKKILLIVALSVILLGGWLTLRYVQSLRTVTVTIPTKHPVVVSVFADDTAKHAIKTLSVSGEIKLKEGDYVYRTAGDIITDTATDFHVGATDNTLTVTYAYIKDKLASIREAEQSAINQALGEISPAVADAYTIYPGELYGTGDWYGTILRTKDANGDDNALVDIYRVVLHKTTDGWRVINYPQITLSSYDYKSTPTSVIDGINNQLPF